MYDLIFDPFPVSQYADVNSPKCKTAFGLPICCDYKELKYLEIDKFFQITYLRYGKVQQQIQVAGLAGIIECNHSSKDLPCHSSTTVFTWWSSFSRLYPLGNSITESSFISQGWCNASSACIRELGGYTKNCCKRFKTESFDTSSDALSLIEVVTEGNTEDRGRLGRRGERRTEGTMLNTRVLAPGSSSNSYWIHLLDDLA